MKLFFPSFQKERTPWAGYSGPPLCEPPPAILSITTGGWPACLYPSLVFFLAPSFQLQFRSLRYTIAVVEEEKGGYAIADDCRGREGYE